MKQMFLSIILMMAALTASAQTHRADSLNERLFDAKVREMVYRLRITDEQKPKFIPIYRRYTEEMIAAWGEHRRPTRPTTTEEAAAMQKRKMERQQRAQAIRIRYIDELATVLNAEQLNRFYDVESDIQKKLKARRKHPRGNREGSHGRGSRRR